MIGWTLACLLVLITSFPHTSHYFQQINALQITPNKQYIAAVGNPAIRLFEVHTTLPTPVIESWIVDFEFLLVWTVHLMLEQSRMEVEFQYDTIQYNRSWTLKATLTMWQRWVFIVNKSGCTLARKTAPSRFGICGWLIIWVMIERVTAVLGHACWVDGFSLPPEHPPTQHSSTPNCQRDYQTKSPINTVVLHPNQVQSPNHILSSLLSSGKPTTIIVSAWSLFSFSPIDFTIKGELIAGDEDGNIRVWDLTANACSYELVRSFYWRDLFAYPPAFVLFWLFAAQTTHFQF